MLLVSGVILSVIVLSSTYFHLLFQSMRRSFIITRKSIGPRTVPCGKPPFKVCQFDTQLAILTRCLRSKRKLLILFVIVDGTFISYNLYSRMLWSIRSKAFEKSSKKPLQRFLMYQFHITGDERSLIGHELSRSFLKNQIVVYQSFPLYTQVANR